MIDSNKMPACMQLTAKPIYSYDVQPYSFKISIEKSPLAVESIRYTRRCRQVHRCLIPPPPSHTNVFFYISNFYKVDQEDRLHPSSQRNVKNSRRLGGILKKYLLGELLCTPLPPL